MAQFDTFYKEKLLVENYIVLLCKIWDSEEEIKNKAKDLLE